MAERSQGGRGRASVRKQSIQEGAESEQDIGSYCHEMKACRYCKHRNFSILKL